MATNNSQFRLQDYIEIAFQRKWLFIIPFVSLFATVTIGSFLLPKVYRATVAIQVLPNAFTRAFDVSSGLKQQLTLLSDRLLSQSYLQNVVVKAGLCKTKDPVVLQRMVDNLSSNIEIKMVNDSLVNVSYQGRDMQKTLRIAKIMAQNFIKESFKTRGEEESAAIDFVKRELKLYQEKIEKAEEATQTPDPLVKRLKSRLAKLEDQLAELLIDAQEDHPLVIELKNAIEETKQELKKLTQGKEVEQQDLDALRMERDMRLNESLYGQLLGKLEAARISQRLKIEEERTRFRIIDIDRIRVKQVAPNQNKIIFSGLVLGILLGVGLVSLVEFIDHSFRSVEDAKHYLALPILGSIPGITIGEYKNKTEKKNNPLFWDE